jgi:hypothetical protein
MGVSSIANLSLVSDVALADGAEVKVDTLGQPWVLHKAMTGTPDGITVAYALSAAVTPANPGRWMRKLIEVPQWSDQAVWYVDPAAANDEGLGTVGSPLKTMAEWCRRVRILKAPPTTGVAAYTINLLGDIPSTDEFRPCAGMDASVNGDNVIDIVIVGQRTSTASGNFVGAPTATVPAANTQATVDLGIDVGTTPANFLGKHIVSQPGGAGTVIYSAAITRIPGGGGTTVAQTSEFAAMTDTGTYVITPGAPANLDAFDIVTFTQFNAGMDCMGTSIARYRFADVWLKDGGGVVQARDVSFSFNRCRVSRIVNPAFGGAMTFFLCSFSGELAGVPTYLDYPVFGPMAVVGCGCLKIKFRPVAIGGYSGLDFVDSHIEDGGIYAFSTATVSVFGGGAGASVAAAGFFTVSAGLAAKGLGIFRSPDDGIKLGRGAQAWIGAVLYGSGNTVAGVNVLDGGHMHIIAAVVPTITGAAEIAMDGGASIPVIVAGLPAAGGVLTTWALGWVAGYGRNAHNLVNGSRIINYV